MYSKTDDNPEIAALIRHWCVLHVKPRTEKKTAEYLKRYKLWYILPLFKKKVCRQRRKVITELPIFPGYVIAKLNAYDRVTMMKTNLIVATIKVNDEKLLIRQLHNVIRVSRTGAAVRKMELLKEGDRIRVKTGPFAGVEGFVVRDEGKINIVINVEMLGQAISVTLSPNDCEKVT